MASKLESRIAALELKRGTGRKRIGVVRQNEDGSWPDAPEADLIVHIRRMGILTDTVPDAAPPDGTAAA